jgi:hypothetical protein
MARLLLSPLLAGFFGTKQTSDDGSVAVEIKDTKAALNQVMQDVTTEMCPYQAGSIMCGITLETTRGIVTGVTDEGAIQITLESNLPLGATFYTNGTLKFIGGTMVGTETSISSLTGGGTSIVVNTWSKLRGMPVGTPVVVANGCTNTLRRCREYGNDNRFRGFPYVPGTKVFHAQDGRGGNFERASF